MHTVLYICVCITCTPFIPLWEFAGKNPHWQEVLQPHQESSRGAWCPEPRPVPQGIAGPFRQVLRSKPATEAAIPPGFSWISQRGGKDYDHMGFFYTRDTPNHPSRGGPWLSIETQWFWGSSILGNLQMGIEAVTRACRQFACGKWSWHPHLRSSWCQLLGSQLSATFTSCSPTRLLQAGAVSLRQLKRRISMTWWPG